MESSTYLIPAALSRKKLQKNLFYAGKKIFKIGNKTVKLAISRIETTKDML